MKGIIPLDHQKCTNERVGRKEVTVERRQALEAWGPGCGLQALLFAGPVTLEKAVNSSDVSFKTVTFAP